MIALRKATELHGVWVCNAVVSGRLSTLGDIGGLMLSPIWSMYLRSGCLLSLVSCFRFPCLSCFRSVTVCSSSLRAGADTVFFVTGHGPGRLPLTPFDFNHSLATKLLLLPVPAPVPLLVQVLVPTCT